MFVMFFLSLIFLLNSGKSNIRIRYLSTDEGFVFEVRFEKAPVALVKTHGFSAVWTFSCLSPSPPLMDSLTSLHIHTPWNPAHGNNSLGVLTDATIQAPVRVFLTYESIGAGFEEAEVFIN